jgi:hypothetical protein
MAPNSSTQRYRNLAVILKLLNNLRSKSNLREVRLCLKCQSSLYLLESCFLWNSVEISIVEFLCFSILNQNWSPIELNIPWGQPQPQLQCFYTWQRIGFCQKWHMNVSWSKHKNYVSCIVLALLEEVKCVEH